jgi:hypothetical protein
MDALMQQYMLNPAKSAMYAEKGICLKELYDTIFKDFSKSGLVSDVHLINISAFLVENGSIFDIKPQLDLDKISDMAGATAMTYLQSICLFELQTLNSMIHSTEFAYNHISVEAIVQGDSIRLIVVPTDTTARSSIRIREHLDNSTRFKSQFGNARYSGRDAYVKRNRLEDQHKISGDIIFPTIGGDLDTAYFESEITTGNKK